MKIKNLTADAVHIMKEDKTIIASFPPDGVVLKATHLLSELYDSDTPEEKVLAPNGAEISIKASSIISTMRQQEEVYDQNTLYIVPMQTAIVMKGTPNVVAPCEPITNDHGFTVGYRKLTRIV